MPTDRETSMAPTDRETMAPTDRETMAPTDRETMMPTTVEPTEEWETIGYLYTDPNGYNKCSTKSSERSFKLTYTTTTNCIGCKVLTQKANGWYAYKIYGKDRRELSEIE